MDAINKVFEFIDQYMFLLNIGLYVILILPIVFGFVFGTTRGFRKSLYHFIGKAIFYLVFIFTLEIIAKALYNSSLFGLPSKLYTLVAHESSTTVVTFKDFFQTWGLSYAESSGMNLDSEYVYALFDMVGVFAFKIVWMIIYFIPINIIYHIILAIIYRTLVRGRVELRKITKDPLLGGVTGLFSGLISTFLIMVMLSGLFSLVRYTGEVRVESSNPETAESTGVSYMIGDAEILLLNEDVGGSEEPNSGNSERSDDSGMSGTEAKMALEVVTQVARRLTAFTSTFYDNKIVSTIDSITVKKELKGETESGEKYGRYSVLESTFDELVSMNYYYKDEDGNKIDVDINIVEELNSVINAILYVVDDDKIYTDDGKIDLSKVKGERIQEAFNYVSEVQLLKVITAVGVAVGAENYLTDSNGEKLSPSEINRLAMKDYTQDIKKIGGVLSNFVDLGMLSIVQDMMSGSVNQDTFMNDVLSAMNGVKHEGETDEEYRARVNRLQEAIADYFKDLEIVKNASSLIVEYVFNNMLKDFVEENGLNEASKNILTGEAGKSYVQNLIDSLDLAADIKLMVQTVFSVAGFNGDDDNVSFVMKNYKRLTEGIEAGETSLTLDDIANFMNSVLAKFSQLSFVNAGIDFAVKILVNKLEQSDNQLKEYLTETNIFGTGGVAWTNEIGEKIPNIINAVIKADILSFITNEAGPAQTFWNKSTEEGGLTAYLTDTINALFALQVVSNLEDTCLKDLLTKYLDSMEMGISIKISDEIGTEGHKYKDEILTLIYLFDNLLDGARSKGATSFEDVFSGDTKYLLAGVARIDAEKLDKSAILAPTIISFLSTWENDVISVPFIYEDKAWYSTYDNNGIRTSDGELYRLVNAIKVASNKEAVNDLITSGATDTNSLLNVIKSLTDDEVDSLFSSKTILSTIGKFLDTTDTGSFKIKVPGEAKEITLISNYKSDDTTITITTETLKDKNGDDVIVDGSTVKLAEKEVIKTDEFKYIVRALRQIEDFDQLMNSDNIIGEFKKLKDNAIDEDGNETIFENDGITHKAKSDVVFKSSILRATIINYLSTMESDTLIVPYIYEDIAWESEFDQLGNRTVKGELYNLVQAIMLVARKDDVINLINNGAADTNSLLDIIKSLNDDETEALFQSKTILCTLTKFLDTTDTGTISIKIPEVAKEELYLSKYDPADAKVTATTETLKDKDSQDVLVDNNVVYLGKRDVIKTEEFKKVVKALNQVQDFDNFMNSSNVISELTSLNGNAIDKDGNETIYKEDNITHKSKTEVLFDSEILRATVSYFLTGDNFDKNFSYPYEVFDSEYYMKEDDINSLFTSLFVLIDNTELNNFDDIVFDNFKDLSFISDDDLNTLASSKVLNATITDKLNSAFGSSTQEVIVPYLLTESTPRIKRVAGVVTEDIYTRNIKSSEIKALIRSVGYFDFNTLGDMDNAFGIIKDLDTPSYEYGKTKLDVILESGILNATISDVIMRMSTDTMTIIVVEDAFDDDEFTEAGKTYRYKKVTDDNYKMEIPGIIDKDEINNLVKGFKYIDTSAFLGGDNIFNLLKDFKKPINITSDTLKVDEILKSKILKETISNYVIKLDVSSININVPYNLSTLESLDPIANYSIGENVQEEVYSIKKNELRSFIIAASTLDIDKLSSDPQKSVLELSQNVTVAGVTKEVIEFLLDSKIFSYSLSDYIVTKSASLGFAAITIPEDVYQSEEKIDISVSGTGEVTKTIKYSIDIDNTELVNLVNSIKYIDLNNIATNTLNVLSSLTSTELDAIEASNIMRFTLSSQVIDNAGSGASVSYIVPKQSFELTSGSYTTYQIYDSFNENTGVITSQATKLVKMSEIRALIEVLNIIDLTNVTSEDVIRLSLEQLNTILDSNIVRVNISDKFKTSLQGNANVSSGYNTLMESDSLTYSATNDYANALTETITREEIANVFNSVKIMGVSNMSTFSVDVQTLYTLRDNGDNSDDDHQAMGAETRVDYLRSILFRTLLSQNVAFSSELADSTKCETNATDLLKPGSQAYLKVSTFTDTLDNVVFQGNVTTAPANLTVTNNTTNISWNDATYHYGDANYRVTYSVYLNGEKKYSDLTTTSSTDIMTLINGSAVGIYKVQVVGIGERDYTGYGTWLLNAKPVVYDELEIRKEANLSMVTNVTQDENDVSISFNTVPNANKYELVFTDLDDLSTITLIVKEKHSSTPVSRSLKNVLTPGHKYSFTIKPISNNEAYLSEASSIYSSPNEDPFYYKGELDQMIVEYSNNMLDFSNLEKSITPTNVTYEITIGSDVYTYDPSDSTSDLYSYITIAEKYFALDLEALSNNNLINSGTVTFIVKAMRVNFKSSEAALDVKIYTNEFENSYSVNEDTISIDISSSHIAEKYTVRVYKKSDNSIVMDKIFKVYGGMVSFSDSRLKADTEYYIVITPYVAGNVYTESYTFDYQK